LLFSKAVQMTRRCRDCGATDLEAMFPGARKPRGRIDRCTDCIADPAAVSAQRVAARRLEIARLRASGRYRVPKPFHTAPLFAGLRP
jgi:hypothetical protein